MPKTKNSVEKHFLRHNPLDQQILGERYAQISSRIKIRSKRSNPDEFVGNKLTKEILKQARQQQDDLEGETGFSLLNSASYSCLSSSDQSEVEEEFSDKDVREKEIELVKIDEEDEKALENFMGKDPQKRATLSDIIKETITEKQTEFDTLFSEAGSTHNVIDNKNLLGFKELVPVLKDYRSGRLPKAFKAIPRFSEWELILCLTEPDNWSAATMYQATRMFSSNLEDKKAQRFYNLFLLPRLRDDIAECKTLNPHLYQALKKSLYKPAAFFKGIIIPLCESGNCTLREATIIGSVLAKWSVPVLHSSAALLTIAEMDYNGANSVFMRILIEKKYALPYRVVNAVVDHFLKFMNDTREFTLLWHQCLLTFVQIYKIDLSPEQKDNLLKLLTVHNHSKVTPEIRKELEGKVELTEVMQHLWKM